MNRRLAMVSSVSLALLRVVLFVALTISVLNACSSEAGPSTASAGAGVAGGAVAASGAASATTQAGGAGGSESNAGGPAAGSAASGASAMGGASGSEAVGGSAGVMNGAAGAMNSAGGASAGASGSVGTAGANTNGGAAGGPPSDCDLPTPVSFQKNIQGFLTTSCGKAVSSGCHVTDTSKTSLGYDHAYDWITAIAHPSSCGKTPPYAKRFEVVLAVINGANPPSCPNSRQMPPAGMGTPLTTCQVAALTAWLAEPMVSQMHVPETDETKDLYPAGPYLMPPFN